MRLDRRLADGRHVYPRCLRDHYLEMRCPQIERSLFLRRVGVTVISANEFRR
jgi:hypothetical protein